jgi:hypothetical protein
VPENLNAIEEVVQLYLDGLWHGDMDKLAAVLGPASVLSYEEDGVLTPLSRDQWLEAMRKRPSPASLGLSRQDPVPQIDQASPTVAFVTLQAYVPPLLAVSRLCLLKLENGWRIAQEVFQQEERR